METTSRERDIKSDLKSNVDAAGKFAADKSKQVASSINDGIDQVDFSQTYRNVQQKAQTALDASSDFIQEHPFYALAGAVGVGLIAGALIRGGLRR
jgi:ElaB/YqjD/DUF883 family membrane-anchored ribosome-binding protein